MKLHLILSAFASVLAAETLEIFSKNLSMPYVVKKTWVDNFIKFNHVMETKSLRTRIVALGCVPSNQPDGRLLNVGEATRQHEFIFSCQQDAHGVISYDATACIDPLGNEMKIGDSRRLSNGTVIMHCAISGGVLKKVVEKASGCFFNNTLYGEDETWVEQIGEDSEEQVFMFRETTRPKLGRRQAVFVEPKLRGRLMQCFRPHYNFFESQLIGCVVGKFGIRIDEYAQIEPGVFVKCFEKESGGVGIKIIDRDELSCKMGNSTVPEGYVWIDTPRAAEFTCSSGNVVKKSCVLGSERIPLGKEVRLKNECVFVCHPGTNLYMCDKMLTDSIVIDEDLTGAKSQRWDFINSKRTFNEILS
ncbi:hypothetical protein PRIPAC_93426 [Pristionchus pacificus]|uniref:Abnormal cell migration protein 18-like fibronectin type I domain-containing protein n=1 Tax=Pristionchus pacificus TaxID=54126 RepID=A0A2A6CEK7_PRIPA|nr:hypothetical protein PRIPAC_93426 [Pristionchus pacificus]|eukprot:PDM76441.1 hypothetical protein PRIPAC_40045 [Pristionchus pacificus]